METSPTKAPVRKQLIGAVLGMGIAAVIYGTYETVSNNLSLSALLIDTPTISENANQVRVNNKNVDDEELRLIASRARLVASQQEPKATYVEVAESTEAETIVTRTEERRLRRFENDGTPVVAVSPVANGETHGGAPLQTQAEEVVPNVISNDAPIATSTALPSSGFGTTALMILALLGTAAVTQKKIFGRA